MFSKLLLSFAESRDHNGARFPVENSSIRGRRWYKFSPHGELNGGKVIPIGDHGEGDGWAIPVPDSPQPQFIRKGNVECTQYADPAKAQVLNLAHEK